MRRPERSTAWAVLVGGGVGGVLDIAFAIGLAACRGMPPVKLLQTVASGWLGKAAYGGGLATAALGLASHFAIACVWAVLFVSASRRIPALTRHPFVSGPVFGVVVFLVMRLVVLPVSAFPFAVSFRPLPTLLDLLSHMVLFGLPIALAARRAAR